jgi:hypothetical protein
MINPDTNTLGDASPGRQRQSVEATSQLIGRVNLTIRMLYRQAVSSLPCGTPPYTSRGRGATRGVEALLLVVKLSGPT